MKRIASLGLVAYLFFLGILTLAPFDFRYVPRENWLARSFGIGIFDVAANLVLFFPWGVFLSILLPRASRAERLRRVVFLGGVPSLLIELTQIIIPNRFPSVIDLVVNTLGSIIGYLITERITRKRRSVWMERHGHRLARGGLIVYFLFLLSLALFSWEKLDRWDPDISLWIGNGPNRESDWPGTLYSLAIYDRPLTDPEIGQHYQAGHRFKPESDLLAYYPFDERAGRVAHDRVGIDAPLDLHLEGKIFWLKPAGAMMDERSYFLSKEPARNIQRRISAGSRFTVEVWIEPAPFGAGESGSIVCLTKGPADDHLILRQHSRELVLDVRNRIKKYSVWSALETPGLRLSSEPSHVVAMYDRGRMALYVNGRKVGGAVLTDGFFLIADVLALDTIAVGGRAFLGFVLFWPFGLLLSLVFRVRSTGRAIGVVLAGWALFGIMQMLQVQHPAVFFTSRTAWVPVAAILAGVVSGWFIRAQLQLAGDGEI